MSSYRKEPAKRQAKILVVDDDPGLLRLITIRLRSEGYEVEAVPSAAQALLSAARFRPDLVVTDLRMDKMDGMGLLKELQARWPSLKVIILTAHGTIPDAVRATQGGAFGFLTKPVEKQELLEHVKKALKISGLPAIDEAWRAQIITRSPLLEEKLAQAQLAASSNARVLLTGEAGVGKKLLARAIHKASQWAEQPFVAIAMLDRTAQDIETLLFGEEAEVGLLTQTNPVTVLLDEVADLPMSTQSRLVEYLTESRPTVSPAAASPRLMTCTRRDLTQLMTQGRFREDLYYRLNVVHIDIPSLARRREDIPLLASHFLTEFAEETGTRKIYAPEAIEVLASKDWPGNVRQLRSVVHQNVALCPNEIISAEITQAAVDGAAHRLPSFDDARDEFTRNYLMQILQITGGNVSQSARLAKRNRTDFYKLLARHQLSPDEFKPRSLVDTGSEL